MNAPVRPRQPAAGRARPLSDRLAGGFAVVLGQTLAGKLLRVGSQIALAWFLTPADFGVAALALAAFGIGSMLCVSPVQAKMTQLSHRSREFVPEGTALSLLVGVVFGAVLAILARPLAAAYGNPDLRPLLYILAVALPLQSLGSVPRALLNVDLRFGTGAALGLLNMAMQVTITVALAWGGFGVYAFVIPLLVSASVSSALLWRVGHAVPLLRRSLTKGKLWQLAHDMIWIWLAAFPAILVDRGVYFAGGRMLSVAELGRYYFAFMLVTQFVILFGHNIGSVLMPGFSRVAGQGVTGLPRLVRAARLTVLLGGAGCLATGTLARPLIEAVFPHKWIGAVPLVQVFAVGLVGMPFSAILQAYLRGEGRFATVTRIHWIRLAALGLALWALGQRGLVLFGAAVAVPYLLEPLLLVGAVGPARRERVAILVEGLLRPLAVISAPALAAFALVWQLDRHGVAGWPQLAAGGVAFAMVWLIAVRFGAAPSWRELRQRLSALADGLRGVRHGAVRAQ